MFHDSVLSNPQRSAERFYFISLKLATSILEQAPTDQIVTTCPFCQFNFSYTIHKTESSKKIAYITDAILKALS